MKGCNYEIVIVDDSTDNTKTIAKKILELFKIKYQLFHRNNTRGKGSAVAYGIKKSKGEILVVIDADLEYHPRFITKMVKKLDEYDLVTAARIRRDPFYRRVLGGLFRTIVHLLFNISFETQSGLKVIKRSILDEIELKSKGWVWDVELIKKVMNKNGKVATHIIPYSSRELGKSKITLLTPFYMLKDLLLLRLSL